MIATDSTGGENQIVSTKVVFNQSMRTLYFVIPSEGVNKYDVRCIIDIDSTPAKSSEIKAPADDTKDKPAKS
jgi:hypothetical protein